MSPTKKKRLSRWLSSRGAALAVAAVVVAPLGAVIVAESASAHTPTVGATCEVLTVDLQNYQPSKSGQDAVDPVTKTVYQRYSWNPKRGHHNQETPDKTGSTPLNDASHWQANTTDYAGAGHGTDPIGQVFQRGNGQNSSWFYWTSEEVTVTPGHDAVPPKTNHVTVITNGSTVADQDFSTSYNKTFSFADKTVANTWTVKVTAYDDPTGSHGWTFTKSGTTTPCVAPPTPSVSASITGVAVCNADTHQYDITWTGTVAGVFDGYVAQRVKYTTAQPPVMVQDGATPGDSFSYTTHAEGTATMANAKFHVHVTQTAAGVNPLDADATGSVTLAGDCVVTPPPTEEWTPVLVVTGTQCTTPGSDAGTVTGSVTDSRTPGGSDTESVTYALTVDGSYTDANGANWDMFQLAAGETHNFSLQGLGSGDHIVAVSADHVGILETSTTVHVADCDVTPPPVVKDATASVSIVDATCTAPGEAVLHVYNAVAVDLDQTPGEHQVNISAIEGHAFKDGNTNLVLTYTVPARLGADNPKCATTPPPVTTTEFTVTYGAQACVAGSSNDTVAAPTITPADAASVDMGKWVNGKRTVTVTPNEGFAPKDGVTLTRTYTDAGSNCGTTPPNSNTHKTPTKVQTDGDTSPMVTLLGGLLVLALVMGGSVLALRPRRD